MPEERETIETLQIIADYQFGAGAGSALFPADIELEVRRSTSGRPTQVLGSSGRRVTLGQDGRFTLGYAGGRRLASALAPPRYRVTVGDESEPFVADGENAFAKFVREVDPDVRAGDEVLVVSVDDGLLGVGRAELSASAMRDCERGVAVTVREGHNAWRSRS